SRFVRRWSEAGLLAVLAVTMLWKGGKSLESTWLFAAVAAVLVLLQAFVFRPAVSVPRRLWWPVMALLAWTALSYAASTAKNYGFDELLQSAAFSLLLCWTVRQYVSTGDNLFARRAARTIAFAAYLACAIGVAVYVLQPVNRFVGSFFDYRFHTDYWPNAWAQLCLLSWPLVVWTLFSPEAGWKREQFTELKIGLHWMVTGFFVGCFLLSYSRAGFLAFVGQLGLAALLLFIAFRSRIDWKKLLVAVLTVAFTAMLWFSAVNVLRSHFHPVESVVQKATFSSAEGSSSFSERAQFWKQAAVLSLQRPLLGWGPYSFRFVQPRLQDGVLATADHAHNVFLKFAMERGWPAALLLILAGLAIGVQGFRSWKDWSRRHVSGAHLKFAMFIGFAGVTAHNLVDYNLQFVGILLPLCIVCAVLAVPPVLRQDARRAKAQRVVESVLALVVL
ncbi:MAG TPA: O-antigen ligase family protein, partial [Candidatus Peribacteria bacterium]|nr:O-antigen ligase family protein [Candidatus Peribacteria bacterium]